VSAIATEIVNTDASRWLPAYVAIGSNLGDSVAQVRRAFAALGTLRASRVLAKSALYRTRPFGSVPQPDFINAVAGLITQATPEELLEGLRALERTLGREPPRERWGPRVIDLDLLVVGAERRDTEALKLPHPGIAERDFVLYPLADISPDLVVPGLRTVRELKTAVENRGIERLP
jgi:2-amino-4-hydroxy-6-hydroxymethyldihydropteridine diphosphokinase